MIQIIYIEFVLNKHNNTALERAIRKAAAKEYQKMFSGTRVSYMERLFNKVS
jgi:hypothetical protein